MALPKIAEARQLEDDALEAAIIDTKRRLFDLRFKQATRQLQTGLHQFKLERHRLAQLMTVRRERQLLAASQETAAAAPPATATSTVEPVAAAAAAEEE